MWEKYSLKKKLVHYNFSSYMQYLKHIFPNYTFLILKKVTKQNKIRQLEVNLWHWAYFLTQGKKIVHVYYLCIHHKVHVCQTPIYTTSHESSVGSKPSPSNTAPSRYPPLRQPSLWNSKISDPIMWFQSILTGVEWRIFLECCKATMTRTIKTKTTRTKTTITKTTLVRITK